MDLPKVDKHCGSVYENDGLWNEYMICDKIIMFRKVRPFNMVRRKEHKLSNGNHLKNLDLEIAKKRL